MKTLSLSVSQFNTFVKNIFDNEEFLHNICIYGEITNCKSSAGNIYFDLKDENALLSCVKFGAGDIEIKNGDRVTVFGRVNFYVKSGRLNFIVSKIQENGLGELYQKFLQLKAKLESEGLFREEIKKAIPKYSRNIGVVTSETGAVIRDIINVTKSKNKYTNIIVYPSKVQGIGAEFEIAKGIEYFNIREDIDVVIVARGGGSFEDLSPFNTEVVARQIFNSQKPIISAVGHETDFTICDFAADLRVPTPSVAAEVAVFDYLKVKDYLYDLELHNYDIITDKITKLKESLVILNNLSTSFLKLKTNRYLTNLKKQIAKISEIINYKFNESKNKTILLSEVVSKLNPIEILKKGYATIETDGYRVDSVNKIKINDEVKIRLNDGNAYATIIKTEKLEK